MKGHVLGHDSAAQATVLRGGDGLRYRFSSFEWREATAPEKGEEVDFEPEGGRARDVYRVGAPPRDIASGEETAGTTQAAGRMSSRSPAQVLLHQPFMRTMLERPVLPLSMLVLAACLLTAYTVDGTGLSLLAAPELAWRMSLAIDGLVAGSGANPGPRLAGAVARIATVLLLFLYAVPVLAAVTLWREFVGRSDLRMARFAGIAAMTLPLILPAFVVLIVRAGVLPGLDVPLRLGRDGLVAPAHTFHPIALFSAGTVLVMCAGFGLWAAATGRLAPWLNTATGISASTGRRVGSMAEASAGTRRLPQHSEAGAAFEHAEPGELARIKLGGSGTDDGNETATGPSRDAMMALTERLRLAISGSGGPGPAERPATLSEEEVDAVYAPSVRQSPRGPERFPTFNGNTTSLHEGVTRSR